MKIIYRTSGGFEFIPEDGRDQLFLGQMFKSIPTDEIEFFDKHFRVDLSHGFLTEKGEREEVSVKEAIDTDSIDTSDFMWCEVERLVFEPWGLW